MSVQQTPDSPSRIWPELPPEMADLIATHLTCNDVACNFRLINKAASTHFHGPQHTTIHLSQPVPQHAFARHWCTPGVTRAMSLERRRELMSLTAASGVLPNLEVALSAAGCKPTEKVLQAAAAARQLPVCELLMRRGCPREWVLHAAAKAGHPDVCDWLVRHGCPLETGVLETAARSGHKHVCEWLLAEAARDEQQNGEHAREWLRRATLAAAEAGHADLVRWLVNMAPPDELTETDRVWYFLMAVAEGCDLATLQYYHTRLWAAMKPDRLSSRAKRILRAAACSPTPDWRAKVEWLDSQQGFEPSAVPCLFAAGKPDAVERLTWMQQRGYLVPPDAVSWAAAAGNAAALQYMHEQGIPNDGAELESASAGADCLPILQYVRNMHGFSSFLKRAARVAAAMGNLVNLRWLVDEAGVELDGRVVVDGFGSGSMELMTWLRDRSAVPDDPDCVQAAAQVGNEEALEWLAERGCPMPDDGEPYITACRNRDHATLRCLRRLGCPWAPVGAVFTVAAGMQVPLDMLHWLLSDEAGCPIDPELAAAYIDQPSRASNPIARMMGLRIE